MNERTLSRPILIKPLKREEGKLVHIEFESNPLNSSADYLLRGFSQSLLINYHAVCSSPSNLFFSISSVQMTINKLIECFFPSREHDLQG